MSFAAIEARATAAIFRRLANAQASFPVGAGYVSGGVVFDAALGTVDDVGVQTLQPSLLMTPDIAPSVAEDDEIIIDAPLLNINAVAYRVRAVVPQAEGGMQRLVLARA